MSGTKDLVAVRLPRGWKVLFATLLARKSTNATTRHAHGQTSEGRRKRTDVMAATIVAMPSTRPSIGSTLGNTKPASIAKPPSER
jgi:hypothetical protein